MPIPDGSDTIHEDFSAGMLRYGKAVSQMDEAMKAYGATFCWEVSARKYMQFYQSML